MKVTRHPVEVFSGIALLIVVSLVFCGLAIAPAPPLVHSPYELIVVPTPPVHAE